MPKRWIEFIPFIQLYRRHWKWMALGALLGLIAMASSFGLLALSGWFISATAFAGLTLANAQLFNFFYPSIGVRFFAMGRTLARYAERVVCHEATFRILESLRSWFYIHLEPLAPGYLTKFRSGDILNRIVADIDALDNLYLRVLSPSLVALGMSVLVIGFLWIFDLDIAASTGLFLFMAGFFVPMVALNLGETSGRELTRRISDLRIRIVDGLQGLPELLVFAAYHRHLNLIKESHRELIKCQRRMSQIRGFSIATITIISGLAVLTALFLGVRLVNRNVMEGTNLALVALTVLASFDAILPLPSAFLFMGRTREAARRLLEIVHAKPEVNFPDQSSLLPRHFGLKFENVSFRYNKRGPLALDEVNFQILPGQRAAVVGETGSGKSTLVHLLGRFWNPSAGHIRLGDGDIRDLSESDLRRHISVATQQVHMFNTTLKENLRLANPEATDDELYAALESAQLLDFVKSLPEGLNTWIGEGGKLLSGGQSRRMAVARAILHNAPVWVLDEPTEGLDPVTERKMMQSLFELTEGRTFLLITHRLLELHRMNHIVILERGQIVAQGTHESLLKRNSRYAVFYEKIF